MTGVDQPCKPLDYAKIFKSLILKENKLILI